MKMYPVVIRVEVLKTYRNIAGSSAHNLRLTGDLEHVDKAKTPLNKILVGTEDVAGAIKSLEKKYGKARKDSPLAFEMICTVSKEYFADKSDVQVMGWALATITFAQKRFGKEAVVQAFLHLDEEAPHLHLTIVPLAETIRKNRYGEKRATKINYSQVLGIPKGYYPKGTTPEEKRTGVLQTEYAEAMAPFGLIRGTTRREPDGGPIKNISPRKYRDTLAADLARLAEEQEEIEVPAGAVKQLIVDENKFNAVIAKQVALQTLDLREENAALRNRINAVEQAMTTASELLGCPLPTQLPQYAYDMRLAFQQNSPDDPSAEMRRVTALGTEIRREGEERRKAEEEAARKLIEEKSRRERRVKGQRATPEERRAARAARRLVVERDTQMNRITHQITYMEKEISHARQHSQAHQLRPTGHAQETGGLPVFTGGERDVHAQHSMVVPAS